MIELYEKATRAAYENCLALLDESKVLARHSKFARAYALCVIASEEFCKSFLYKGVSAGLVEEERIRKIVINHSEKIARLAHIIVIQSYQSFHADEIQRAMEHDRGESDHAKHIYLDVMREISKNFGYWSSRVTPIFAKAHKTKLSALYVDIIGNQTLVPTEAVGRKDFNQIFNFLNSFLRGFEIILKADDTTFSRIAESIDPGFHYILKPKTE